MKSTIWAYKAYRNDKTVDARLEEVPWTQLDPGEVTIRVHYSSINYKDALGATGKGMIYKKFPIIGGIDASGVVEESEDNRFSPGMQVLVTGCGLGENHDGGYAEYTRVPGDWVVPLPEGLSLREAMALGTAGFTAALCIQRMEDNGQTSDKGPIVVTGASGGVGSLAVNMLSALGFGVIAVSGKTQLKAYLQELGAKEILSPDELLQGVRPLESVRWGGAIDNVGGAVLSGLLPRIQLWGNVASVGLAGGHELKTTVMPFILRGVSLLGISSTNCPYPLRKKLWGRLAAELKPRNLRDICKHEVGLSELGKTFHSFLDRKVVGRYVVNCQR